MEQWLKQGGALISPKISVQELPGRGRGIIAKEKIQIGETLIKLRRQQLVNFETIGQRGDEFERELRQRCSMPVFLAYYIYKHCKDENNYWTEFMKSLPTEKELQDTMPLVWLDPKHRALLPRFVLDKILKQYDEFNRDYETIKKLIDDEKIDQDKYKWAWLCVNTRCIYMDIPGLVSRRKDKVTLAPYADYLNHTCGTDSVGLKIDGRGLVITSSVEYNKGDEVFLSYGPHDNATLLIEYGFVVNNNSWDSIDISTFITPKLKSGHINALQELGYYGDQFTINTVDGASFRTEMALATLLEPSIDNDYSTHVPSKLTSLAEGTQDVEHLYPGYNLLLSEIKFQALKQIEKCRTRCGASSSENTPTTIPILLENYKRILNT